MESQLFDQFLEDRWSAEPCESKPVNTGSDLCPDYLWLNQYNPLNFSFEEMQSLDDLQSSNLFDPSSPSDFALPSPISETSSLSFEDRFDQKSFIDPWALPLTFENPIDLAAPHNSPFGDHLATPSLASSPESSEVTSPCDIKHESKKPTTRTRKPRAKPRTAVCKAQTAHNLIEKRYRNNLNTKIATLRDAIPRLRSVDVKAEDMDDDTTEQRMPLKCNKGIILDNAIRYIAALEKDVKQLEKENAALQAMVKGRVPDYLMVGLGKARGYA
ncbi:hypothetical protein N431DRAFT_430509 [Stipitochalara longipes BDJ]|nr:hypothetical protein N431DRAFT_430509 [Stipitochalara longipes BDJ]